MIVELRKRILSMDNMANASDVNICTNAKLPIEPFIGLGITLWEDDHVVRGVTLDYDQAPFPKVIVWLDSDRNSLRLPPPERFADVQDSATYYEEKGWKRRK